MQTIVILLDTQRLVNPGLDLRWSCTFLRTAQRTLKTAPGSILHKRNRS